MQTGLGTCHSPEPLLSLQAVSVRGSYQSWAPGSAQPQRTAAGAALTRGEGHREGADLSEGGSDSRGFLGSPEAPGAVPAHGADRAFHPAQSPRAAQTHHELSQFLPRNKLSSAQRLSPGLPTAALPAGRVSRCEINSKREKSISPEVDRILFTNSFCSAMKEVDPALSLRHKLPLMKLLGLLKWEAREWGLVTILSHWP